MISKASSASISDSDEETSLVRRIAAGDRLAFEVLMRRCNRRLFRLARSMLGNDAEAEDALQETYIRAYRSMADFRGDSKLSTWLSRMALNECLGRLRKGARRDNVIPIAQGEDVDMVVSSHVESAETALGRVEMRALLERKLDELPKDFRTVFVLREVEEMSIEETAACLDLPQATVRSRHFRARSLLRESLAQEIDVAGRDLYVFGGVRCDRIVAAVQLRLDQGR
jgi:RNA polymerase sigma-70 factor (ECF subfamily)